MTLLRDLIDIPRHVGGEDFVLRLLDGIDEKAQATLDQYVITPQIAQGFDQALSVIQNAMGITMTGRDGAMTQGPHHPGRGVYLHGSFGSGKSHFMAVLYLLLSGNHAALSRPELAGVVARHGRWMRGKKFLLLAYHMLGADSIEARIFDGYVQSIGRHHPGSRPPHLFNTDTVLADAEALRQRIGDEAFLRLLGESAADEGWGDLGGGWTLKAYHEARKAGHDSTARQHLVSVLIERAFPSAGSAMSGTIPFDRGLELMTRHARVIGYDAIILLLDELILWLASRAGDPSFIPRETEKLVNLVEAQHLDRPIPIVSFIARQRDLRELIGREMTGAEELAIDDKLAHHEGRFSRIELSTTDLPEIASKRLLEPQDEAAKAELDRQFERAVAGNDQLIGVLCGDQHSREDFRKVYPFSPALVDTLVAASSMLQRDRTALRAMLQLLVDRRDTLEVGEIIPVGDLYDVISRGHDAITPHAQRAFERARRLYEEKFIPLLEQTYRMSRYEVDRLDWNDPKRVQWRADDRIMKTILLGALVSGVPELEHLTASRIAALNHGTVRTPIPGTEAQVVLRKLRDWASRIAEITLTGDAANPTVAVALTGVDVERILQGVAAYDGHGNRLALLKELVLAELGIEGGASDTSARLEWRGTAREARVILSNVGDLPLQALENDAESWKVFIDYPIDDDPSGPAADRQRIAEFTETGRTARTLIWLPAFLNEQARGDLGRLVRLNRILRSDQTYDESAAHLSATDRVQARGLLTSQRDTLRTRVCGYLRAAYGLSNEPHLVGGLDATVDPGDQFVSLDPSFAPRPPAAGSTLKAGLEDLLQQALAHQFPAAPAWEKRVRPADVRKTLEIVRRALATNPPRTPVDTAEQRLLRDFALPLELGQCTSAFALGDFWVTHFDRHVARAGGRNPTVRDLRRWMDDPQPRGLPADVQDLLTLVYTERSERAIFRLGAAIETAQIGGLQPDDELRLIPLPTEAAWVRACERAGAVFGEAGTLIRSGAWVASLARRIRQHVRDDRQHVRSLVESLNQWTPDEWRPASQRLRDAEAVLGLLDQLNLEDDKSLIERLATATIAAPSTPESLGAARAQAAEVVGVLGRANRTLLDGLFESTAPEAAGLAENLQRILTAHAHVVRLQDELPRLEQRAAAIFVAKRPPAGTGTGVVRPVGGTTTLEKPQLETQLQTVTRAEDIDKLGKRLRKVLDERHGAAIDVTWTVRQGDR